MKKEEDNLKKNTELNLPDNKIKEKNPMPSI